MLFEFLGQLLVEEYFICVIKGVLEFQDVFIIYLWEESNRILGFDFNFVIQEFFCVNDVCIVFQLYVLNKGQVYIFMVFILILEGLVINSIRDWKFIY